jgi:hypothetical protein
MSFARGAIAMRTILFAVIAWSVLIGVATAASAAPFNAKVFFDQQQRWSGGGGGM